MKTLKVFATFLLMTVMFSAKAQDFFPAELVLVSQPTMMYYSDEVRLYYDVQNIGDERYKGYFYIYLDPDNGSYYARQYVRVNPGEIRRIVVSLPSYRLNPFNDYVVMPYYSIGSDLFSLTTFDYFEPIQFCWRERRATFLVMTVPPRIYFYDRPIGPRFYYDGYRPHLHPGYRPDPHIHTYAYHHNYGGYPATHHDNYVQHYGQPYNGNHGGSNNGNHNNGNNGGNAPQNPGMNGNNQAHVNPQNHAGSMSSNGATPHNDNPNGNGTTPNPNSGNGAVTRPHTNSGAVARPYNNSSVTRPSSNNNSSVTRPSSNNNGSVTRPSSNNNSSMARPSTSSSGRNNSSTRGGSRGSSSSSSSRGSRSGR